MGLMPWSESEQQRKVLEGWKERKGFLSSDWICFDCRVKTSAVFKEVAKERDKARDELQTMQILYSARLAEFEASRDELERKLEDMILERDAAIVEKKDIQAPQPVLAQVPLAPQPVQVPHAAQPVGATCRVGCGRPCASGFDTCCQTCLHSSGTRHGPRCEAALVKACPVTQAGGALLGRLQTQAEEVSVVTTTKWEDFKPVAGLFESLRSSPELRVKVPELDRILQDVEAKVGDVKFDANARDLVQQLDDDELSSIVAYTHDLQQPGGRREGNFYYEENNDLRKRDLASRDQVMRTWAPHIYFTMRGLGKLPDFEGDVFRGYSDRDSVLQQYHEGRTIQWGAWSSTTELQQAAMIFAGANGVVLKIKVFTGKDIKKLSFFASEGEILLSPNHRFIVTSSPYMEGGCLFVNMTEVRGIKLYS